MALRGKELELELNLREWARKGHLTREYESSRRFSASCIRSFREDYKSSLTNFTISSTASSPAHSLKDEIDPSNYSFTSAFKALQAKTEYKKNWDWLNLKPEGVELHSKWNEAEKYICNPLSGEVPMECLSARTLNSRSFRNLSTMHAPLMILPYNNPNLTNPRTIHPNVRIIHEDPLSSDPVRIQEKKVVGFKRDVGVQSAPVDVSPAKTPPIMERSTKRHVETDDSLVEYALMLKAQQEDVKLEGKELNMIRKEGEEEKKKKRRSGCFSWMRKMRRQPRKSKCFFLICFPHLIKYLFSFKPIIYSNNNNNKNR